MKNSRFLLIYRFISEIIQNRAIITMEGEYETIAKFSNGTSFNNLE